MSKIEELIKEIRCESTMCHYADSDYYKYFYKDCEGCPFCSSWSGTNKEMLEQAANELDRLTAENAELKQSRGCQGCRRENIYHNHNEICRQCNRYWNDKYTCKSKEASNHE